MSRAEPTAEGKRLRRFCCFRHGPSEVGFDRFREPLSKPRRDGVADLLGN